MSLEIESELEKFKFAREQLEKERSHRREKVWKIFSWAGTLLVAIIGGVFALKTNLSEQFTFSLWLQLILIVSVLVLTASSCWWIKQNQNIEDSVQNEINIIDRKVHINWTVPKKNIIFGYIKALIMLGIAAIAAILIPVSELLK